MNSMVSSRRVWLIATVMLGAVFVVNVLARQPLAPPVPPQPTNGEASYEAWEGVLEWMIPDGDPSRRDQVGPYTVEEADEVGQIIDWSEWYALTPHEKEEWIEHFAEEIRETDAAGADDDGPRDGTGFDGNDNEPSTYGETYREDAKKYFEFLRESREYRRELIFGGYISAGLYTLGNGLEPWVIRNVAIDGDLKSGILTNLGAERQEFWNTHSGNGQ